MSLLQWKVETKEGTALQDEISVFRDGPVHVVVPLPAEETFRRVSARIRVPLSEDGRVYMNGYQGATYAPERGPKEGIRGLMLMHQAVVTKNAMDRYGDYHFVEYPNKRGITHGFSYCYFREGERFYLVASLDEGPGYTMFTYDAAQNRLTIERDCVGMKTPKEGSDFHAFDLLIVSGTEQEVFDTWFEALGVKPRTTERLAGYASGHGLGELVSAEGLSRVLEGAKKVLQPKDLIRIDGGWQKKVGDWQADEQKFPEGMKNVVDAIHEKGYRAGLWLAPFLAEKQSDLYREHPDWLYLRDGEPWRCGNNWSDIFALDFDHKEVQAYLKETFRLVLEEWGFDLVRLDYLYAAAPFGTATESRAARMMRALDFLRELAGDKLIEADNVPLMPAFGRVDYCRISPDVTLDWDDKALARLSQRERPSTRHAIGNAIYHRQLDRRAFLSDPDVFFLRKDQIKLSAPQKVQLYEVCAEYGSMLLISDDPGNYTEQQAEQYRNIRDAWESIGE